MQIEIKVPDGVSGNWQVNTVTLEHNEIGELISMAKTGRGVPPGTYKQLLRGGRVIMSNTPNEIRDFMGFVRYASGSVLINGLGIGVVVQALLDKPSITDITIIEQSEDVINLVADTYRSDPRVIIIHADAFNYKPPKEKRYNAVWHDIWDDICTDNLEEMKRLHRKYGRISNYQESWCRWQCERAKREYEKAHYWDKFFQR